MRFGQLAMAIGMLGFGSAPLLASDIDLSAGDAISIDGNHITCERNGRPTRSWSCSITCQISGFQDTSDVNRPLAQSAANAGTALDGALQRCADLDQKYVEAFKLQHPTWPIYISWKAMCGGQEAGIRSCCAED